ncbi:MFS transporter [Saccharopolyspora indica]|uniref:MFS transporter n=1 Tax=Saccharopolyspora indica TaxID=1229659 RepID=UPI0022EB8B61|nr:MFS transporter [Saccharopolyspora indica]MDA3647011.1 MFS transporter [Saccharopolyspora indica]
MATDDVAPRAGRREWLGLAVLVLPTFLTSVDVNVMFLALPHIAADLGATGVQQLWITDIYGFMLAGFLVTLGTLGDRYGRRRILLIGAAGFALASLLAAFAGSTEQLIAARALLGIAGATIMPSTLALITNMFKDPKQMSAAIAIWSSAIMTGVVIGPVIGGLLLGAFHWGAVFLIAVPVMALLLVGSPLLPEHRAGGAGRLDLPSVVLSLLTLLPLIQALKDFARIGFDPLALVLLIAGIGFGALFVRRQRKLSTPLLDLRLFGDRAIRSALLAGLLIGMLMAGVGLVVTQYLQLVLQLSPVQAGLWLVPPSLAMIVASNIAPRIARRVRPAYVLAGGMAVAAAGLLLFLGVGPVGGSALLVVGLGILYVGASPVGPLVNFLVMSAAPPEKAGSVSSLQSTGGELGVALGIALLGSLSTAVYRNVLEVPGNLPADVSAAARQSLAEASAAAPALPAEVGGQLVTAAQQAFTSGLHVVAVIAAVLAAGLGLLAVSGLRHIGPTGDERQGGDEPAEAVPNNA